MREKTFKLKGQKLKAQKATWLWLGLCVWVFASGGWCAQKGAGIAHPPGAPEYRIAGVVVDAETGAAIAGAELSIAEGSTDLQVKADNEGRFVFEGMAPGKYAVAAGAPGYVQERYQQHAAFATAMAVGPELDSEHMVFRLHRQAVITGTVTDERGEAIRKAQVMLFAEQRGAGKQLVQMALQTGTDDLGAYRFAHLAAGKYYIAVTARPWYAQNGLTPSPIDGVETDFGTNASMQRGLSSVKTDATLDVVYPTTFYPGVTDEQSAGQLVVSAGEITQADVRLQAVSAMHVRLTNVPVSNLENGESVGIGAEQRLFGSASTGLPLVTAQIAPGVYEVAGLPPGQVTLTLNENRTGEWENRTIHLNASDGESVDARATGATANVTGRVAASGRSGAGLHGNVLLTGKDGQTISRNVQKDGSFSFAALEAGTYEVSVNLNGDGTDYVERVAATGAKMSGEELTIEEAGDVRLTVWMGRGFGQVKGVVKAEGKPGAPGKPEADVMVLLAPASGGNLERDVRMDQSDSDGSFTLTRIVPGKYVLLAIKDGWDLDWTDATALAPYRENGQVIEIGANEVKNVAVEASQKVISNQ